MSKLKYLLFISLFCVLITLIFFINFLTKTNDDISNDSIIFEKVYNNKYFLTKMDIYKENELVFEQNLISNSYIMVTKNYITICNLNVECTSYKYVSDNTIIKFNSFNEEFEIGVNNDVLELYRILNDRTIIYYFEIARG